MYKNNDCIVIYFISTKPKNQLNKKNKNNKEYLEYLARAQSNLPIVELEDNTPTIQELEDFFKEK